MTTLWKQAILDKHDNKCVRCGSSENLTIHHIFCRSLYPKLRCKESNLTVLCEDCHQYFHNRYIKNHNEYCVGEVFGAFLRGKIHDSIKHLHEPKKINFMSKKEKKRIRRALELEGEAEWLE